MKIYLDENLPPSLAKALDLLNEFDGDEFSVHSLVERFGQGAKDEEWIPILGEEGAIVITQDYNIHTTRSQYILYQQYGLGVFFLKSPSKKKPYTYWEMVNELIEKWHKIKKIAQDTDRPFGYRITKRKIEKLT